MPSQAVQDRTAHLIAQAATLHADLAGVWATSSVLIERGRDRRFSSIFPRLRRIQGGSASDLALIAAAITGPPMCLECIKKKTGVPALQVETALTTISRRVKLVIGLRPCSSCRTRDATFSLPASAESVLRQLPGF